MDLAAQTILVIVLFWVVPLVAACAYFLRDSLSSPLGLLRDSLSPPLHHLIGRNRSRTVDIDICWEWILAACLRRDRERLKRLVEYRSLHIQIRECRKQLARAIKAERDLEDRLEEMYQRMQDPDTLDIDQIDSVAKKQLEKAAKLIEKIGVKSALKTSLRNQITVLEKRISECDLKLQTFDLDLQTFSADKVLRRAALIQLLSTTVIDKMEEKVIQREQAADQIAARIQKQILQREQEQERLQREQASDAVETESSQGEAETERVDSSNPSRLETEIVEAIASSASKIRQLMRAFDLVSVLRAVDPSIERAYDRFRGEIDIVRKLTDESVSEEDELQQRIDRLNQDAELFASRATMAEELGDHDLSVLARQRMEGYVGLSAKLAPILKEHRKKNFWTTHRIFRLEVVLRRLLVVKLLLSALPGSIKEELSLYLQLVNDLCLYLRRSWLPSKEDELNEEAANFEQRLSALENQTMMVFIRIARGEYKKLSSKARLRTARNARAIVQSLNLEAHQQLAEIGSWEATAREGLAEQKSLVYAVASHRRDQYHLMWKTTKQAIEVLNVTATIIDGSPSCTSKASDSKQGGSADENNASDRYRI